MKATYVHVSYMYSQSKLKTLTLLAPASCRACEHMHELNKMERILRSNSTFRDLYAHVRVPSICLAASVKHTDVGMLSTNTVAS
jgi:hypothetical protein